MGSFDRELRRLLEALEGSMRPPEPERKPISDEARRDCDELVRIIRDAGDFRDLLAIAEERHPEWTHYERQLDVKRQVILREPDGERLWKLLASASDRRDDDPPRRSWR